MLAEISAKLSIVQDNTSKIAKLEDLLQTALAENSELKLRLTKNEEEVLELKMYINNLEQHHRLNSVRVHNVKLHRDEESNNFIVMKSVYEQAFLPILEGAVSRGILEYLPSMNSLLETAHVLPGVDGKPKPVIARFFSRYLRSIIFKLKKDFAKRSSISTRSGPQTGRASSGALVCPIYEDLTRLNYAKLRSVAAEKKVEAAWTTNGVIRYKLAGDNTIKRVSSVFAENSSFIK